MEESPIILERERLVLRYQLPSDVEALVELWSDPQVTEHMGGPRERAALWSAFEETGKHPLDEPYNLWPVVEKDSGELVGHCGLLDKALKRHAFETLGLGRPIALIEPGNVASESVAIKVGMRLQKEIVPPGGANRLLYAIEAADDISMA
jgi:ribosomal-protein-alanine N-acetyltransferase